MASGGQNNLVGDSFGHCSERRFFEDSETRLMPCKAAQGIRGNVSSKQGLVSPTPDFPDLRPRGIVV